MDSGTQGGGMEGGTQSSGDMPSGGGMGSGMGGGMGGEAPGGTGGMQASMMAPGGPVDSIRTVFRKYATFSGRAGRAEFWWYALFVVVVAIVLNFISSLLLWVFWLVVIIPTLAVEVRRLHDTGRSGWWLLLGLVPIIGGLVLLYWYAIPGSSAENQYGPPAAMAGA